MYGPHLILEGYGAPKGTLDNMELIYNLLDEFPALIGMTKIMPPHVQRYLEPGMEEWGVSGFVIIAESPLLLEYLGDLGGRDRMPAEALHARRMAAEDAVRIAAVAHREFDAFPVHGGDPAAFL